MMKGQSSDRTDKRIALKGNPGVPPYLPESKQLRPIYVCGVMGWVELTGVAPSQTFLGFTYWLVGSLANHISFVP